MNSQPPQWPDQSAQSAQRNQPSGSGLPLARLMQVARSRLGLAAVAVVSSLLIVALLCMLVLVLASNAGGSTAGNQALTTRNGQTGQTQNSQAATADAGGGGNGNGTSSGSGTPPSSGTGGGAGTTQPTPTPTPSGGGTLPIPTGTAVAVSACLLDPCVHQVVNPRVALGSNVERVLTSCPRGEIALSGGWQVPYNSGASIYISERYDTGSWVVYFRHSSTIVVSTYAECLENASSGTGVVERVAYKSLAPGAYNGTYVNCNAGEVVVGGGFALQSGLRLYSFGANTHTVAGGPALGWYSNAWNYGTSSANLRAYVECLTFAGVVRAHSIQTAENVANAQAIIAQGTKGGATSDACPSGMYVSGGGYGTGDAGFVYAMGSGGNGTSWTVNLYAYPGSGEDQALVSQAMCLGFS